MQYRLWRCSITIAQFRMLDGTDQAAHRSKIFMYIISVSIVLPEGRDKKLLTAHARPALSSCASTVFTINIIKMTCTRLQNGEHLGLGFYSELDNDQETIPVSTATSLFPSPSRTDDSDTNWSERASSQSSSTPVVSDTSLPTMTLMGVKRERITEIEVKIIVLCKRYCVT